jgi:hypothetical protein
MTKKTVSAGLANTSWWSELMYLPALKNHPQIDILNPVQFTAANMDLKELKQEFSQDLVFWGAGVDT